MGIKTSRIDAGDSGPPGLPADSQTVRQAAARGARSVTHLVQVIDDAVAIASERWEDAVLRNKSLVRLAAWAFRVGANAARRILGGTAVSLRGASAAVEMASRADEAVNREGIHPQLGRMALRRRVLSAKKKLVGRQLEVVLKLCEPEMSFHRAAKELGMHRWSVRRSFFSALRRLGKS
jgi:DNA-directed RNA polymerase specialized sigma24 family protein